MHLPQLYYPPLSLTREQSEGIARQGWRQRRLGSEPKTHLRKTKIVLTQTGLEGPIGNYLELSGNRFHHVCAGRLESQSYGDAEPRIALRAHLWFEGEYPKSR